MRSERLRKSLGVDSLDISTGSGGDSTVGVRRAINNRISIGVKGGATPEDSGVTVDIDETRRVRIQGEATMIGYGGRRRRRVGVLSQR